MVWKTWTHTDWSRSVTAYKLQANTFAQPDHKFLSWTNKLDPCFWLFFVHACVFLHTLGSCAYPPVGGWRPDCQGYSHQGLNRREIGPVCRSACRNPDLHLSSRGQQSEPTVEGDVWGERGWEGKKISETELKETQEALPWYSSAALPTSLCAKSYSPVLVCWLCTDCVRKYLVINVSLALQSKTVLWRFDIHLW